MAFDHSSAVPVGRCGSDPDHPTGNCTGGTRSGAGFPLLTRGGDAAGVLLFLAAEEDVFTDDMVVSAVGPVTLGLRAELTPSSMAARPDRHGWSRRVGQAARSG